MSINVGTILNNRYKILELAGTGGMAKVYKATDLNTGEVVAIKTLKSEYNDDLEFVRRFDLEARAAASLSHPNIVNVYGVGEDNGVKYIVQEYVNGKSLKEKLEETGKMDWRLAVPIVIQIALALEHAHSQSIVHRDIKPANILITPDGVCMVTDFGIARATNSNTVSMTGGTALGSVHYFSPEQARGGAVDHRSDVYSLGILMYELLTGEVPFDGDSSVAVAIKQLQEEPVKPRELESSIPQGLEDIILRCMQKNPNKRYPDSRALIDDLDMFMINPNGRYGEINSSNDTYSNYADPSAITKPQDSFNSESNSLDRVLSLENSISSRRKSRSRDTVITMLFVVIIVLLLSLAIWFIADSVKNNLSTHQSSVEEIYVVEDFRNMSYDEVSQKLKAEGVNHIKVEEANEEVPSGNIISQNIAPGSELNRAGTFVKGSELILTVSKGSEFYVIPDLIGKDASEVKNAIEKENILVMTRSQFNVTVPEGKVVEISPSPGTKVERGSRVTITISKGINKGPVPDVKGRKLDSAIEYLNSIGFDTETRVPSSLKGYESSLYVVDMTPKAGTSNVTEKIVLIAGTYEEANPTTATTTEKPSETTTVETTETENTETEASSENPDENTPEPTEPTEPAEPSEEEPVDPAAPANDNDA